MEMYCKQMLLRYKRSVQSEKIIILILSQWRSNAFCVVYSQLLMMLRRKTFFLLLKNVFLISTIVDCGFFCKRGKRFPYHMNFLGDVYMNLNYHLAGQTWSIPCPCVFSPPHKLTSSHCKHFPYSSPSLCTKSCSRINLNIILFSVSSDQPKQ